MENYHCSISRRSCSQAPRLEPLLPVEVASLDLDHLEGLRRGANLGLCSEVDRPHLPRRPKRPLSVHGDKDIANIIPATFSFYFNMIVVYDRPMHVTLQCFVTECKTFNKRWFSNLFIANALNMEEDSI